jgi:protein-S-isoprenylcysteine O-methyltransferase Ste14
MRTPKVPNRASSQSVRLPLWVALIFWPLLFLLVHVAAPWAISLLSTRHGWTHRRPGRWNRLALLLVGAGAAGVGWCLSLHVGASSGILEMERTPRSLLLRGPYRFTRNPIERACLHCEQR